MGERQRRLEAWKSVDEQEETKNATHGQSIDVNRIAEHFEDLVSKVDGRSHAATIRTQSVDCSVSV
jgi:hypothetical protein